MGEGRESRKEKWERKGKESGKGTFSGAMYKDNWRRAEEPFFSKRIGSA